MIIPSFATSWDNLCLFSISLIIEMQNNMCGPKCGTYGAEEEMEVNENNNRVIFLSYKYYKDVGNFNKNVFLL